MLFTVTFILRDTFRYHEKTGEIVFIMKPATNRMCWMVHIEAETALDAVNIVREMVMHDFTQSSLGKEIIDNPDFTNEIFKDPIVQEKFSVEEVNSNILAANELKDILEEFIENRSGIQIVYSFCKLIAKMENYQILHDRIDQLAQILGLSDIRESCVEYGYSTQDSDFHIQFRDLLDEKKEEMDPVFTELNQNVDEMISTWESDHVLLYNRAIIYALKHDICFESSCEILQFGTVKKMVLHPEGYSLEENLEFKREQKKGWCNEVAYGNEDSDDNEDSNDGQDAN